MENRKPRSPISKTHPDLAREAFGWSPEEVSYGSERKLDWICRQGHVFQASPNHRTSKKGTGCPYCSNMKVLLGFNDLESKHPDIASEAYGWKPSTVTPGSEKKLDWKCRKGHIYKATVFSRTGPRKSGCPICSNLVVLEGFNDLASEHPEIAKEAHGWDPKSIVSGTNKSLEWKCPIDHIYSAPVNSRTGPKKTGCPFCSNFKLLTGFNDLQTKHPEIAKEAHGWDPSKVNAGSVKKLEWKCVNGHVFSSVVEARTGVRSNGCPVCAGKKVHPGFNDLESRFPHIAAQADGWNPQTVISGSNKPLSWICSLGHKFKLSPADRTLREYGCPICSNHQVLAGFNDLATKFPDIAREASGWDPRKITPGSEQKRKWKCPEGHIYVTSPMNRTGKKGTGCPSCASSGYDQTIDGYLYLLEHPHWDMFQIGISNSPVDRIARHSSLGWIAIEVRGPMDGLLTQEWETAILRMLKANGADLSNASIAGKFDGYSEAWSKSKFPVTSIQELMRLTESFEKEK